MNQAFLAMMVATSAHKNQKRKYTNAPYIEHPAEVAGIVASVYNRIIKPPSLDIVLSVSWLHDVPEDTDITIDKLSDIFDFLIIEGVIWLTNVETGNRSERKAAARIRLSKAPSWVQTIKVADVLSNMKGIFQFDKTFARVYLNETQLLLESLSKAESGLKSYVLNKCIFYKQNLNK